MRPLLLTLSLCALLAPLASGEVQWSAPMMLEPHTGRYSSLEAGPGGALHLAYLDHMNGDLRYAVRSAGGEWSFETVDTQGDTGWFASLELDSTGVAHIAYSDASDYKLKYAVRQGPDDWDLQVVDGQAGRGWYCSLALDSFGRPHIAYSGNAEWDLRHAWHDGEDWDFEIIDSAGRVGLYCSLALTADDLGRICYCDKDNMRVKFAWQQPGGGWLTEVVDDSGDVGIDTTIDLDDQQRPHVAYWDRGNDALAYAWHDGADWHVETVEAGTDCGYEACIVWADGPRISYEGTQGARYAEKLGEHWDFRQVSAAGDRCGDTALALEDGQPRMTWLNLDDGSLYYAEGTVVPVPGDATGDGCVDGADYTAWADHYGQTGVPAWSDGGWTVGNWNEDNVVDGADYTAWADHYGQGCPAERVPEPACALLLLLAGACVARQRR